MKLTNGQPFWLVRHGMPFDYPKLQRGFHTPVLIVGGGVAGALISHQLGQAGIASTVVDARTIGLGSTGACTALLQYELDVALQDLVKQMGRAAAERCYWLCSEAIDALEIIARQVGLQEFERKPSLYFSQNRSDLSFLEREMEVRRAAGFAVDWVDKEALRNRYGMAAQGGILSQQGAATNAYLLTHQLLQHGLRQGSLQVFARSAVTEVQSHEGGVELLFANGAKLTADHLVVASGAELSPFWPDPPVQSFATYGLVSQPFDSGLPIWQDDALLWATDDPYLYLRRTTDNRLMVGGRDERMTNDFHKQIVLEKKTQQLQKDVEKLFPQLSFEADFNWCGSFGRTRDGLPYIGAHPKQSRTYYATGFAGNGVTLSLVAAQLIAQQINGLAPVDAQLFRLDRGG